MFLDLICTRQTRVVGETGLQERTRHTTLKQMLPQHVERLLWLQMEFYCCSSKASVGFNVLKCNRPGNFSPWALLQTHSVTDVVWVHLFEATAVQTLLHIPLSAPRVIPAHLQQVILQHTHRSKSKFINVHSTTFSELAVGVNYWTSYSSVDVFIYY